MGFKSNRIAEPAIGEEQITAFGGISGSVMRPIVMKYISRLTKRIPGINLIASGGMDSAEAALQYLYAGASIVEVCSAVQNQDYTIIEDFISALKASLYLNHLNDPVYKAKWNFQCPPDHELGESIFKSGQTISRGGRVQVIDMVTKVDLKPHTTRINDLIGGSVKSIRPFQKLPIGAQKVALVNDVSLT